jgi:hypothetical protein
LSLNLIFKPIKSLNYHPYTNFPSPIKIKVNASKRLKGSIIALRVKPYT